ncbi:DUF1697 domain-containing protein [Kordiimonas sp. SCSIO 12610]|uniref:DUF1697 domain-containing protein n=1 Tax=Kordiimonas sp. SCSIO 12610 TaxID=2829597 RepID=UPI002108DEE5|nr:DUF1697 domain-containing protein [Kordiimonas sp. SCSIO 12610]UTW54485.1 DUF1697 domain-containing protein [Kordiimonas sp. SCSIO 12610]
MKHYIALFRGINVGGKNLLPMKDLKAIMDSAGCRDIQTYIQSGNAVFGWEGDSVDTLKTELQDRIEAEKGFRPTIHILSAEAYLEIIAENPYDELDVDPKTVHINFLITPATNADMDGIKTLCAPSEHFTLTNRAFFLHAPDGIGRSKLAAKLESLLGVEATGRNLRTVNMLKDMLAKTP